MRPSSRHRPFARIATALLAASCVAPSADGTVAGVDSELVHRSSHRRPHRGPRVLCVTAHPDDEMAFGATLYKLATHLDAACDLAVVTRGDGGYKYSTLAERTYDLELTDPAVGRAHLPAIRRRELLAGGEILGLRRVFFLNQRDHRNTKNPAEVLAPDARVWDLDAVRGALDRILWEGEYDFLLTHLPEPQTHGHHQAATILALQAVERLPPDRRPVALGTFATRPEDREPFVERDGFPVTRIRADVGTFEFDREQKFGFDDRLDYRIVVNWALAEHKSQGTMQMFAGRGGREKFQLYALGPPGGVEQARQLFARLAEPQFTARSYDENGESDG